MNEELQNQIERYLRLEMNEEEERNFAERINNDDNLKKEVELTAMIIGAAKRVGKEQDLSEIEMLKQASTDDIRKLTKRTKPNLVLKTVYWVTSSAAVILLAFTINHFYSHINCTAYSLLHIKFSQGKRSHETFFFPWKMLRNAVNMKSSHFSICDMFL